MLRLSHQAYNIIAYTLSHLLFVHVLYGGIFYLYICRGIKQPYMCVGDICIMSIWVFMGYSIDDLWL